MALKRRVLVVLNNDINVDVRVLNELRILKKAGAILGIICTGRERELESELADVPIWRVDQSNPVYKFKFISATTNSLFRKLWKGIILGVAEGFQPDIIHTHDLYMGFPVGDACEALGIPFIIDLHENYPVAFRGYSWTKKLPHRLFVNSDYWSLKRSTILERAAGIVVLDAQYGRNLKVQYPEISHVPLSDYPNVPNLTEFKTTVQAKAHFGFKIFYFGMVSPVRNLHVVSRAVGQLRAKGADVELLVAGSVTNHDRAYFQKEVMGEGVRHIPWINLPDLGKTIAEVDVCICPIEKNAQHESGVANKVFQYMYFGKPLLVSNCAPQEELVRSTGCGISYEAENVEQLVSKIAWMMENRAEIVAMGEQGKVAVNRTYNADVQGEKLVRLYQKIFEVQETNSKNIGETKQVELL